MRKRAVSAALAVLLAMSLGIPAFADAAQEEEEDFFATSLDLARYLEQASGAAVRELLTICCPMLTEGYEDLNWDSAPARVRVEFFEAPFGVSVEITSSQLGEAMLRSLDGDAAVTDAEFTAELDIFGVEEGEDGKDDYDEYRVTAQDIMEEAQTDNIRIEDREGQCPACGTAADFLRTVYESARSTR